MLKRSYRPKFLDYYRKATFTGETERDGKTNPVKIGVLMVWHKQNGDWKLLARQAVRLEEPRTN